MSTEVTAKTRTIHPDTSVGLLSLTVSDLERSLDFYTQAVGFQNLDRSGSEATLGAGGQPLLLLREQTAAKSWPRNGRSYTGLYHFAILVPTREDLGSWVKHWLDLGHPIGQGDHRVSEALYLEDPDLHGIEIYRDRPRDEWEWDNGRVRMGSDPVDIRGMIEAAERAGKRFEGLPPGTKLGHMHLQVGDIPEAERFYNHILGFDIVASMPTALFVSAGGYHHHIGMNTWHSQSAPSAPSDSVRLSFFTIDLPNETARQEVLDRLEEAGVAYHREGEHVVVDDPWGNRAVLQIGAALSHAVARSLSVAAQMPS
ncbi:MAG TPA: VOC family protein [Chloroflexota bacterium]|jgi:catechol 2,3-dioxygenase|nr:VOC family protein [Chloroflexota bacterium]